MSKSCGCSAKRVELHECAALAPQIPLSDVAPGVERRVDEHVERRRCEVDPGVAARRLAKRRGELPAGRQHDRRLDEIAVRVDAVLIEQGAVPVQDRDRMRRHGIAGRIHQHVEIDVHALRPSRHGDVKRVQVDRVPSPVQLRPVDRDLQRREIVERSGRSVLAGNPLRIDQRQRPGGCRDVFVDAHDAVGGPRCVDDECRRPLLGCKRGCRNEAAGRGGRRNEQRAAKQGCAQSWHGVAFFSASAARPARHIRQVRRAATTKGWKTFFSPVIRGGHSTT